MSPLLRCPKYALKCFQRSACKNLLMCKKKGTLMGASKNHRFKVRPKKKDNVPESSMNDFVFSAMAQFASVGSLLNNELC